MNNFINNIVSRHVQPANNIQPRVRGRFEPLGQPAAGIPDFVEPSPLDMPGEPSSQKKYTIPGIKDHLPENIITTKQMMPADTFSAEKVTQETIPPVMPADTVIPPLAPIYAKNMQEVMAPPLQAPLAAVTQPHSVTTGNAVAPVTAQQSPVALPGVEYVRHHRLPQLAEEARSWLRGSTPPEQRKEAAESKPAIAAPVIQVTIGRIEVRAVTQPAPAKTQHTTTPVMSLDEFLKRKK